MDLQAVKIEVTVSRLAKPIGFVPIPAAERQTLEIVKSVTNVMKQREMQ